MEPVTVQMSVARVAPWSFKTDQGEQSGVTFRFQEWEFRHDATLMLVSDGKPVEDARKSPLYRLQEIEPRSMVMCEFEVYQDRRQEQRNGQRDSVKDVIGLRLKSVRPVGEQNGSGSPASLDKAKA